MRNFFAFEGSRKLRPLPNRVRGLLVGLAVGAVASSYVADDSCLTATGSESRVGAWLTQPQTARLTFAGTPTAANAITDGWQRQCKTDAQHTSPSNWQARALHQVRYGRAFSLFAMAFGVLAVLLTARAMRTSTLRLIGFMSALLAVAAGLLSLINSFILPSAFGYAEHWLRPALLRLFAVAQMMFLLGAVLYVAAAWLVFAVRRARNVVGSYEARLNERTATVPYTSNASASSSESAHAATPSNELEGATGDEADLTDVIRREIDYISHHRYDGRESDKTARTLVGLALSGGGIRSATSCLGVLQSLSQLNVLPLIDYVSSVSGGGYMASCLTSLLSLNDTRLPTNPSENPTAKGELHEFEYRDRPAFATDWPKFPFRDDRDETPTSRRAAEVVAQLRTHGNFLIARRGVLTRDTLRAVGNVLTGVVFHVAGFLLFLFGVTALYLATVQVLSPDIKSALTAPRIVQDVVTPGQPRFADGLTVRKRVASFPCDSAVETCKETTEEVLSGPDLATWIRYEIDMMTLAPRRVFTHALDAAALRVSVLAAIAMGVLLTLMALGIVRIALDTFRNSKLLADPQPGEADEDVFDKSVLWAIGVLAFAVVLTSTFMWKQSAMPFVPNRLIALWLPLLTLGGARVVAFLLAIILPQFLPTKQWDRRFRTLWGGYQAILVYSIWASVIFLLLAPVMFALAEKGPTLAISAVMSLLVTRLLTSKNAPTKRIPAGLLHASLAVAVSATMLLGVLTFGAAIIRNSSPDQAFTITFATFVIVFALGWLVDMNKLSLHYFYRDRLAETYLLSELKDSKRRHWTFRDSMSLPLRSLHGDPVGEHQGTWRNTSPYHLISCAINLAGSRDLTRKDRKSGYWLFSKLFCGSVHTGFRPTAIYRKGETKLGRALAISGAAASPGMGFHTFFAQAFATALFNVRLGYWTENPRSRRSQVRREGRIFWPAYLWREVTMQTTDNNALVNLSDGGHTGDNVGIYPLLQRRCKVIIAIDAEQDASLTFGSFTEALRHAYVDEGINVDIDLSMIRPDKVTGYSRSHCAVGRILYPDRKDQASWLIYVKNSLTGDEPEPVLNYKSAAPAFPHETTADQFFTDAQFESYRALGAHIAKSVFAQWGSSEVFRHAANAHAPKPVVPVVPVTP
ncbi:MAG: hypothetical protein ABJB74_10725 [Gemmatimonas sp.]